MTADSGARAKIGHDPAGIAGHDGPEYAWRRAWRYTDHGKDWDAVYNREHPPGFRWLHESFGTNWRLTEMQSAIGRVQLGKLPAWLAQRRANASVLLERLTGLPGLRVPVPPETLGHAWYKFYAFVEPERLAPGWDRDAIVAAIQGVGVPCMHGGCSEVYREKAFEGTGYQPTERLPVARELGETSVLFPVGPHHGLRRDGGDCLGGESGDEACGELISALALPMPWVVRTESPDLRLASSTASW
ncbi:MAG: DegT/DnrJ/EryC1/StrS family aminotransferase [Ectothiorhodospiraceae bacterium]